MFEIGRSLREARERKRVSHSEVEQDTKIRSRYLRALEEEQFAVLPGPTYTKGFLRAYADYLGLDGQLFIDEFNSRHHDPRGEVDRDIYPRSQARGGRRHRKESNLVMIVLAAIVAISALIFLGFSSQPRTSDFPVPPASDSSSEETPRTSEPPSGSGRQEDEPKQGNGAAAKPKPFTISMRAAGDCWITAHLGSPSGRAAVSVKGTNLESYQLSAGVTATIRARKPLFLTFGAPGNIESVTLNGRRVELPFATAGSVLKVTRGGITTA